jgi:hypothetical protein
MCVTCHIRQQIWKIWVLSKKRSGPYWISRNTGNFFCFNSSLSNLYNNVIIYTIKKKSWEQFCLWTNLQNFPIHVIRALDIDMFLYPTLTIQASSRLKHSTNHLWNNSYVCRKKFGEWSPLKKFLFLVTAAILNGGQCCRTQFWKGPTQGPSLPGLV